MLLGIVLHGALAYVPATPWPVHDPRAAPWLVLVVLVIHGFRMPLFFLVSGFFTATLWSRGGAAGMLGQRCRRVLLPLVLAGVTLLPAVAWVAPPAATATPLVAAIRAGDAAGVTAAIAAGADPEAPDPEFRVPPLALAALVGHVDVARRLLDAGADADGVGPDGRTPLHAAAFAGRPALAELLLDRGADPAARGPEGDTPLDATRTNAETTALLAGFLRIALDDPATLRAGRAAIRDRLAALTGTAAGTPEPTVAPPDGPLARLRRDYREWLTSSRFVVPLPPTFRPQSLFRGRFFGHLWFLWFIVWFSLGFAALAALARVLRVPAVPRGLVASPAALLWTVPLTLLPQAFMGLEAPTFGADTSLALLPQPHVLAWYAVFFGYGAVVSLAGDAADGVGRRWPLLLAAALLVCFPVGLVTIAKPDATALPQVLYAWLMSFGCIGFFRWLVPAESRVWRYLSDSSYWIYLAHLPLVVFIQTRIRGWPWPGAAKFGFVCVIATVVLLASYQVLVRHTPLGVLLNGPRRPTQPAAGRGY